MNPRYSFSAKIFIEHGNTKPNPTEIFELSNKLEAMCNLVFGDKLLQTPDVLVVEDEEQEKDYTVYAEVQAILKVNLTVTSDCTHNASCIAEGLINDLGDYLDVNNEKCGIELAGTTIDGINIFNVELEQDSPQGENC